jgi:hypothetical protein
VGVSCLGSPGSNGFSSIKLGLNVNHISWETGDEPDWLVMRPNYPTVAGSEIRSVVYISLVSLKAPTSPVYTFPLTPRLTGFVAGEALTGIAATGTVLAYTTAATGVLPLNTNIETLYPTFLAGYQTDTFTGPSEKIIINLKRLKALGFDKVNWNFGVHYINTNFGAKSVPLELAIYKGGGPQVVNIGGTATDWSFPTSTQQMKETLFTRDARPVIGLANTDYMMTFELSLSQKRLIFYPIN